MTTASHSPSILKPSINMQRLHAVLFPHWALWAMPSLVLALCALIDGASPRIEVANFGYAVVYFYFPLAWFLMLWRYVRFHTFDWFLHRVWCGMVLYLWVNYTTSCIALFSHMLFAFSFPLIDRSLAVADQALGFDWNAYAHVMYDHPWVNFIFSYSYANLTLGGIMLTPVIAILRNDRIRVIEICFLMSATALTCVVIGGFFPAYPAADSLADAGILRAIELNPHHYLAVISTQLHALREAAHVVIDPRTAEGLVCFPSFHCCMALIIFYCNRGLGPVSWLAYLAGIVIIVATPVYGGHYLVDIFAGGLITLFYVWVWNVKILPRLSPYLPGTSGLDFALPRFFKRLLFMAN
ncbi:MAG TPA: phosphatase PAP2 family protein [Aestuariivirga sp.]